MATNTEKIVVQVVVQGDKQLDKLDKKAGKTTKSFGKMAAGIVAASVAFRQVSSAVSNAMKSFRDFEFQMAKVKAVTGASEKDFKKLSNTAKELGRTTFFTATQVAELQTNYGKLGFSTREILDAQEATLQLATATDTDLGRAAIVAGASIRGFGLDASEAGRVVDVMAKAFTSSALDIEKFQTSMTKVAPISAAAGISLEATTAVMATLTDAGIEASIAGTSLRNIFLKMQDSSSELSKFLGYTVNSSDDLERALNDLNTAGLTNEQIMSLVDLRQVAAFNTMVTGSERVKELTKNLDEANGAAADMAAIVADTLEGSFKRLTSATEGLAIELTEKLGGGIQGIVDKLAIFFNKLTDNSEALSKVITNIINLTKLVGLYKIGVSLATVATKALNSTLVITRSVILKSGVGAFVVLLGTLAEKLYLSGDAAEYASKKMIKLKSKQQIAIEEEEHLLKLLNKQLATNLTQSKENISVLESQKKGRENLKRAYVDEIKTGELSEIQEKKYRKNVEALDVQIAKLNKNIGLRMINQRKINDESKKQIIASKSLITLAEEEMAILKSMPETTEKEITDKHKLIDTLQLEIDRLKELGRTTVEVTEAKKVNSAQDKVNRRNLQIEAGLQKLLLDNKITQEQFDDMFYEKQIKNIQSVLDNELLTHPQRMALQKQLNDLKLKGMADEKTARQEQIDGMKEIGNQLIFIAGEEENLQGVKQAGIAISKAAAIATSFEAMADYGKAIANAAADSPWYLKIINVVGLISSMASTLSLIKSIKSSFGDGGMIEEFANGGMVHGKSHAQGGEKFAVGGRVVELEGGEAVINKRSTAMFGRQLSAMNAAGGGVKFADGGLLNQPSFSQQQFNALGQNQMMGAMGGASKVVVVEADITSSQNTVSVIQSQATI